VRPRISSHARAASQTPRDPKETPVKDTWTRAVRALRALWCGNCGAYIDDPDLSAPCPKCGK
jgi:hypothetical protein